MTLHSDIPVKILVRSSETEYKVAINGELKVNCLRCSDTKEIEQGPDSIVPCPNCSAPDFDSSPDDYIR